MAIREKETKKYPPEEIIEFNQRLNKFYSLATVQIAGVEVEVELLDIDTLRQKFVESKPEVPRSTRLESFENLYAQWKAWKFEEFYRNERIRKEAEGGRPYKED